jgi:CubicO group peptidase (beta-lactamase class C family)
VTRRTLYATIGAAMLIGGSSAVAQLNQTPGGTQARQRLLERLDTNGDGQVSDAERLEARQRTRQGRGQTSTAPADWRGNIPRATVRSNNLPDGDPLRHGVTPAELDTLRVILREAVTDGSMRSGASLLVAHRGEVIFREAVGNSLQTDSVTRLGSSTKPFTAAVLAILADQGRLSLDDPLEKYIPEFRRVTLEGGRPPSTKPTVRQTLANGSGISGVYTPEMNNPAQTLANSVRLTADRPLVAEPGTRFDYSGVAFGVAARVAEVVMGKPFEQVMREVLLRPLGMSNTRFGFPETPADFRPADPKDGPFIMGGGGLVSTLDDVAIFYEMLRQRGRYKGKRVMGEGMARQATSPVTTIAGGNGPGADGQFGPYYGFGLYLNRPNASGVYQEFNHGGAFGTYPWADRERELVVVVFGVDGLGNTMPVARRIETAVRDMLR